MDVMLNTACDECRSRKLKCSGRQPICDRCILDGIECVYSPRKKMGRPRKRRREDLEFADQSGLDLSFEAYAGASNSHVSHYEDSPATDQGHHVSAPSNVLSFEVPDTLASTHPGEEYNFLQPDDSIVTPYPIGNAWTTHAGVPTPPHSAASCACLANLYLSFAELQAIVAYDFPQALTPLRRALTTASKVLECDVCPHDRKSGTINLMQLITLLSVMTEHCNRLLRAVDTEAERALEAQEKKAFQMGDSQPGNMHLHTGTPDCPMRFEIELDAAEWRSMVRKVMRSHVMGPQNGQSLLELTDRLEERQKGWHIDPAKQAVRDELLAARHANGRPSLGDFSCLSMVETTRLSILALKL